jgi:drug/metabolite transporter (DMT)-like permease
MSAMRISSSTPLPPAAVAASVVPVYLRLVLVALFWGGTFIAGRIVAHQMPAMTAAALRFAVAVPLLVLVAWRLEGGLPRLDRKQLLMTFALGLSGIFLYNVCFFGALSRMPAGRTALFVALNPIVTALLLALLLRERLGGTRWAGILVAFVGAAVVITRGDLAGAWHDIRRAIGAGELLMLCAVSSWAAYTIIGRFALKGLSPVAATTYAAAWGLLLLGGGAVLEAPHVDWAALDWQVYAAIAYLGVFGTVIGFIWYYQGVKTIGPARTAVFNNLVPVFGILLAALLLAEPVLLSMIVGGLLVVGGVTLTNRQK